MANSQDDYDYSGILSTDSFDNDGIDEITLLKSVYTAQRSPQTNDTGGNYATPTHTSYLSSLEFDLDSSIQCGQQDTLYRVDTVVIDRLDLELHDMPTDIYIQTLLELTNSSEEVLSHYRDVLSTRSKELELVNGPTGILRTRRKPETFAKDCYEIHQFLNHNIPDINALYRKCPTTPAHNTTLKSVVGNDVNSLLRETLAKMQADILSLKSTITQNQENIKSVCGKLTSEVDTIKRDLQQCSNAISVNIRSTHRDGSELKLGTCLSELSLVVSKLETSRNNVSEQLSILQTSVIDNSLNIERIHDADYSDKRNCQNHMKDLRINLTEHISQIKENTVTNVRHDKEIKQINSQIKTMSESHQKTDVLVMQAVRSINTEMDAKMCEMCDKVSSTISKSFEKFSNTLNATLTDRNKDDVILVTDHQTANSVKTKPIDHHVQSSSSSRTPREPVQLSIEIPGEPNTTNSTFSSKPRSGMRDDVETPFLESQTLISADDVTDGFQKNKRRKGRFRAATPRGSKSYVITGIHTDSDQAGLEEFLEYDMNICFKYAKFLLTGRTDCKVAQLVVDAEQGSFIENEMSWPEGISCRPWIKRPEYVQRYQNN